MATTNYQEVSAQDVIAYFIKGYNFKDGKTISDYKWFFDPVKNVIIFKLSLTEPTDPPANTNEVSSE